MATHRKSTMKIVRLPVFTYNDRKMHRKISARREIINNQVLVADHLQLRNFGPNEITDYL
jgi:hypothetical protein